MCSSTVVTGIGVVTHRGSRCCNHRDVWSPLSCKIQTSGPGSRSLSSSRSQNISDTNITIIITTTTIIITTTTTTTTIPPWLSSTHHVVTDGRAEVEVHEVQSDLADTGGDLGESVLAGLVRRDGEGARPAGVLEVGQVGGYSSSTVSC